MKAIMCLATMKLTVFAVRKDEWDAKEGTGKFMKKCIVCTVVSQKAPLGLKQHQTTKNQASQLVCQSVPLNNFLKIL